MIRGLVSNERLTRQELSWLLAQEARGAAKALREGVSILTQPPVEAVAAPPEAPPVETSLDALDEAIHRLSELQMGHASTARRGRIDLAALACEIAPNARIAMEPGAGTEVFGEEAELRRMLHLLVGQTNTDPSSPGGSANAELEIRRQGEFVKISVELGPDASPTAEIERRWLARMATRHGGRLELEGGVQSMLLPADGQGDEMAELRKELEQAQQLGEVYARELAQVVASGDLPESTAPPPTDAAARFDTVIAMSAALARVLRSWLEAMRADVSNLDDSAAAERVLQRTHAIAELATDLERTGDYEDEQERRVDLVQVVRETASNLEARAHRRQVSLEFDLPPRLEHVTRPAALSLLVRSLLEHGIAATPRGGTVRFAIESGRSPALTMQDGGPAVPEAARADLLRRAVDPTSLGRPDGVALLVAFGAAGRLGSELRIADESGRPVFRTRV